MRARALMLGILGVTLVASCKPRDRSEPGMTPGGAETGATPDTSVGTGGALPADTGFGTDTTMGKMADSMGKMADSMKHRVDSATRP